MSGIVGEWEGGYNVINDFSVCYITIICIGNLKFQLMMMVGVYMKVIHNLIKKHAVLLLHILCTVILCTILVLFNDSYSDYLLLMNMIFSLLCLYCVYTMIFKKIYADSFLKIICILSMVITANELYSYNTLLNVFPWLEKIDFNWWIVAITILLIAILIVFKILTYLDIPKSNQENNLTEEIFGLNSSDNEAGYNQEGISSLQVKLDSQKDFFSFLEFLGVIFGLCILILIPIILLYLFNKYNLNIKELDFDKIFSFVASYSTSFLLILFALVVVIITLLHLAKYIYYQIVSFKKTDSEPIPTYAFSVIIVCILLFLSWRISDLSLNKTISTLVNGDYLALPISVMVTMVLFFLLVQITHSIILMLNKMTASDIREFLKKQEHSLHIYKRISKIIRNIIDFILDTILYIFKFINFVPNFFKSLSRMVFKEDKLCDNEKTKKFDSHIEGIKIVKVAAFCFALVSWIATARGLQEFVFNQQYIQALMISFGIQAILFVFNLKLPEYFQQIGKHTPENQRIHRKYLFGKRKGSLKVSFKWTFSQKIIILFYIVVILSSSFFSFVYMTNLVYTNTQYVDANIIINGTYRACLNDTDKYIDEYMKLTQVIISEKISGLVVDYENDNSYKTKTKSELENDVKKAQIEYENAVAKENNAKRKSDNAQQTSQKNNTETWRSDEIRKQEQDAYNEASDAVFEAEKEKNLKKQELEVATQAFENYKPDMGTTVHDILTEILKVSPSSSTLKDLVNNLNEMLVESDENSIEPEKFSRIVLLTKELNIAIDNYSVLQKLQSGDTENIEKLEKELLSENIIIPVPQSQEFELKKNEWESKWKKRFLSLEKVIEGMPYYTNTIIKDNDSLEQVVDLRLLERFDRQEKIDTIDNIMRKHLYDINALEKAWGFLGGNYPFLAKFSLLLALFFDVASLLSGLFIYYTPATKK